MIGKAAVLMGEREIVLKEFGLPSVETGAVLLGKSKCLWLGLAYLAWISPGYKKRRCDGA